MNDPVIQCQALNKSYQEAGNQVSVLKGVNLSLAQGETLSIVGSSGSGKKHLITYFRDFRFGNRRDIKN